MKAWKVYVDGVYTGIVETDYVYASQYWAKRPGCCKLVPY
jgi:hypothetical protein